MTDETGQPWPASEIARALCDCTLTRAVIGTKDADLNLGRQSRLFRRQHWLALYAAGITSCAIAACTIPLAYTELHHLQWWYQHAGRTDLTNCAPYCSYHHHQIHRLGIQIRRRADGTLEHQHPDGRPYGSTPPGATPPAGTPASSTPPVGTPPVGTPPVGTPPIGTPPVETALVGTPPAGGPAFGTPAVGTARAASVPGRAGPAGAPRAAEPPPGGSSDGPPDEPPGDLLELLSA